MLHACILNSIAFVFSNLSNNNMVRFDASNVQAQKRSRLAEMYDLQNNVLVVKVNGINKCRNLEANNLTNVLLDPAVFTTTNFPNLTM